MLAFGERDSVLMGRSCLRESSRAAVAVRRVSIGRTTRSRGRWVSHRRRRALDRLYDLQEFNSEAELPDGRGGEGMV